MTKEKDELLGLYADFNKRLSSDVIKLISKRCHKLAREQGLTPIEEVRLVCGVIETLYKTLPECP